MFEKDMDTIIVHCDFSENYTCKYFREIQTCHFGDNKKQISLHAGVLYIGTDTVPFATISPDLQHDATAIWSHLYPILAEYTHIKRIHFITDSPFSEYRNKGMFQIMLKKIISSFKNLISFSWNYLESGHGTGAADGVGAVIKHTCDRIVASNIQDISNFEQFYSCIMDLADSRDQELETSVKSARPIKGELKF